MPISYDKLWKLLIDKKMNRTDLKDASGISFNVLAKMGKNEAISMESLYKICAALDCGIGDIVEFISDPMPRMPAKIRRRDRFFIFFIIRYLSVINPGEKVIVHLRISNRKNSCPFCDGFQYFIDYSIVLMKSCIFALKIL